MKKLSNNFALEKYGLKVRLVNEADADFILSLRTNPNRTKHMLTLNNSIEKQKEWIREYKKREAEGLDYYFIYSNPKNIPIGVNRASYINFDTKDAKSSSWIAIEGLKYESLLMVLLGNEIAFKFIEIDSSWGELHKENYSAYRILTLFGYKFKDVGTEYYRSSLQKDDFFYACENNNLISRIKSIASEKTNS